MLIAALESNPNINALYADQVFGAKHAREQTEKACCIA
jgi:hypothetical protein